MEFDSEDEFVKSKVKAATAEELAGEPDWALIMELVDTINSSPSKNKRIASALVKRLAHKNVNVSLLAVLVVEALVKNCPTFHLYANEREFLDAFVGQLDKSKKPKRTFLQRLSSSDETDRKNLEKTEKILIIVESWATAFKGTKYTNFGRVYQDLKDQGVRFPVPMKDEVAPVITPPPAPVKPSSPVTTSTGSTTGKPDFRDGKLKSIYENMVLFKEMLNASDERDDLRSNELIQQMYAIAKTSQGDVVGRIAAVAGSAAIDEKTMNELLLVNDAITESMAFYDGLLKGTMKRAPLVPLETSGPDESKSPVSDDEYKGSPDGASPVSPKDDDEEEDEEEDLPKKTSKKKKAEKGAAVVPKLEPPPSEGGRKASEIARKPSTRRVTSESSAKKPTRAESTTDVLDLDFLGLSSVQSAPSPAAPIAAKPSPAAAVDPTNPFDLFFTSSAPAIAAPEGTTPVSATSPTDSSSGTATTKKKKKKPAAAAKPPPVEAEDDFFAIAMRSSSTSSAPKPAAPAPAPNPFDDLFNSK